MQMKTVEGTEPIFDYNELIPVELTSLVIDEWSNAKLQEIPRLNEVYKAISGTGTAKYKNGNTYSGTMENGKMTGEGRYGWSDGTVFEGTFVKNQITGSGTFSWPDGSAYTGDVKEGLRHGCGIYINPKAGYKYEGEWKDGLRSGEGTLTYLSEDQAQTSYYKGSWLNGLKHGYGEYLYKSGNLYKGEWIQNKKHGNGTMVWFYPKTRTIKEKYVGQWSDDVQNGFGTHIWLDEKGENRILRNRYVGYWKNGLREGHGMFFYANGSIYIGQWKTGMKHGSGRFIYENGEEYEGEFSKDRMMDRTLEGGIKTTLASNDLAPDTLKSRKTNKKQTSPREAVTERCQTKYFVTERVRAELEGNPYDPMIDVSDIICLEQLEILSQPTAPFTYSGKLEGIHDAVNKVMLQYNTYLKKWYRHYSREVDCPEIEEGFMMVSAQFWRLLKDAKIFSPWFSLAQYNRIYLRGKHSNFSLHYDPLLLVSQDLDNNDNNDTFTNKSKNSPIIKLKDSMEHSRIKDRSPNATPSQLLDELAEQSFGEENDVHDPMRPMLFRHFAEAVIRASSVYYQFSDKSIKDKLEQFIGEKLLPNLEEAIANQLSEIPSLVYKFSETFKEFDKKLLETFKLHSTTPHRKASIDYTITGKAFIEMAAKALEGLNMDKIDLIELLEKDYEGNCKADSILQAQNLEEAYKQEVYEDHVKGTLSKEIIFYEYKELLAELALCCIAEDESESDAIKRFLSYWISTHSIKERKKVVKARRNWKPTEKELMYFFICYNQ